MTQAVRPGQLKIILGYAAGVGKTYRMLDEGRQLADAGRDVVIGYFEPHGRKDTIARTEGLETVPRRVIGYRGREFEEMDTAAILARRPQLCLVDEFPHTNVPGSEREKRWQDVLVLLDAGIDVITTMNIQHLESLNDQVREITGVRVRETIPDWVMKRAAEVVLADLTPGALLNRLDRGVVYPPDKARRARENFFKEPYLAALRELALRQTAHEVEIRQNGVERDGPAAAPPNDPQPQATAAVADAAKPASERILIHITPLPATAALIRRGRRVADYLAADCFAVCVVPPEGMDALGEQERTALEQHLDFARRLHIETRVLDGGDEAAAMVEFARRNGVTQIFLAKPARRGALLSLLGRRPMAMRVVRLAKSMQVTVVAERHVVNAAARRLPS